MKRFFTFIAVLLVAVTAFAQEAETTRRYGIKSGQYKTEMDMMGQKVVATTWFDDYGNTQLTKTKMSMMGMTVDMGSLMRDGKTYTINYGDKQVQETATPESLNYLDLTEEMISKYKVKNEGEEEVGGKPCIVYSAEVSQMGQTGKIKAYVWEGFPMKLVTTVTGMTLTTVITEFQEGAVDASLFEVPTF